ncbi:MAG: hypothetical protein EZS28_032206 [Streblomastix strix]|uniref:Uncharacterized protein n=1 Tax=Streblomastix strix TaxID=222440 RepID=A0A5J4UPA9_9EUKA|nr:MAG: hypothetical protein EZS28_032206 [Streblomastix strix]
MTQEEAYKLLIIRPIPKHCAKVYTKTSMDKTEPCSLHFVEDNLDVLQFDRILEEHVKEDGNSYLDPDFFFLQDYDLKLKSRITAIENMFFLLKKRVRDRNIRNMELFKEVIKEEYEVQRGSCQQMGVEETQISVSHNDLQPPNSGPRGQSAPEQGPTGIYTP